MQCSAENQHLRDCCSSRSRAGKGNWNYKIYLAHITGRKKKDATAFLNIATMSRISEIALKP